MSTIVNKNNALRSVISALFVRREPLIFLKWEPKFMYVIFIYSTVDLAFETYKISCKSLIPTFKHHPNAFIAYCSADPLLFALLAVALLALYFFLSLLWNQLISTTPFGAFSAVCCCLCHYFLSSGTKCFFAKKKKKM